jgi:hypothetical protein
MLTGQSSIKDAVDAFFCRGDVCMLQAVVSAKMVDAVDCQHSYPFKHRVADVVILGAPYRIVRCVSCNEAVWLIPIEKAIFEPGVPWQLTGTRLLNWANHEDLQPSKAATDFSAYLNPP